MRYDEIASPEHDPPVIGEPPAGARLGAALRGVANGSAEADRPVGAPREHPRTADGVFAQRLAGSADGGSTPAAEPTVRETPTLPTPAWQPRAAQTPTQPVESPAPVHPAAPVTFAPLAAALLTATPTVHRRCRWCGTVDIVPGRRRCPRGHRLQKKHRKRRR